MITRTNRTAAFLATTVIAALAGSASAATINHTDLPNGSNLVNLSLDGIDVAISAPIRTFKSKTVNGRTGVGIAGGAVDGEIDGGDEAIVFAFSEPVSIDTLSISFLYTDGNFGDVGDEVAKFVTDLGDFTLTATTGTDGTWTGPSGTVTNISIATNAGGGEWLIEATIRNLDGIFGGGITSLSLQSGIPSNQSKYSDFSFVSTSFVRNVPTPGAVACAGMAGLLAATRRRTR
jgi:hypothetical protein